MISPRGGASTASVSFQDLLGDWTLVRRVAFGRGGGLARFRGRAAVTLAAPGVADYHEWGRLTIDGRAIRATRRYWIREEAAGALALYFADGESAFDLHAARLFVRLIPARDGSLAGSHRCAGDRYDGRYAARGPRSIAVTWRVAGPRKEGTIRTRWIRDARGPASRRPGAGRPRK